VMNRNISLSIVVAVMLSTNSAFAGLLASSYGGIQFASFDASIDGIPEDFSPTGLIGRLGNNINENFSVEGRLGFGLSDDTITATDGVDTASLSIELDTLIGVYGVGHIMLNESSSIYGLVGFTKVDGTVSASISGSLTGSGSSSEDESGLSYGVGADIGVGKNLALNIEYIQYLNESELDLNAISLGIKVNF
jgi:outer membrane immunogenic protein